MPETLNLNEFQEYINKGKADFAFDIIVNKSIELIKQIAKMKGLSLEDIKSIMDREYLFDYIEKLFEENCAYFQAIPTLMRNFKMWNIELIEPYKPTCEEKIELYIKNYNLILYEQEEYEKIKNEIQEKGYEKIKNEKIQKLISAFKEMLDFKHKNYDEKWTFNEWVEVMDKYYHFYHEDFESTLSQIQRNILCRNIYMDYQVYINTDEVENIIALDDLYYVVDPKSGEYKDFADFYEDIELEEGQTYKELYNEKIERFIELFKKMLDYINVQYQDNSFDNLKSLIRQYFPYFSDNITSLDVMLSNSNNTYISLLSDIDMIYDYFNKTYKNHEENMKKYNKELEDAEEFDLIDDGEDNTDITEI